MIINVITVTSRAPVTAFLATLKFRERYKAANTTEPTEPMAAASVGVATPKKMSPTTKNTMDVSGRTYFKKATIFSDIATVSTW